MSWFLRSMGVVVFAPRPWRIALPGSGDSPDPDQICPYLPAVLPRQQRPVNRAPSIPGRPLVERRPRQVPGGRPGPI